MKWITKRDGKRVRFDVLKVEGAIQRAYAAASPDHVREDDPARIAQEVVRDLDHRLGRDHCTIAEVQDEVERNLMAVRPEVAKAYVLYRARRDEVRTTGARPDPRALSEYVHVAKYAAHVKGEGRRETREETVRRSRAMHLRRYSGASEGMSARIMKAFGHVDEGRVLPSMRSMQFGGTAVERNHVRMYNCSFTLVNRKRVFGEVLVALLCGCGVGFSIQMQHVERLPEVMAFDRRRVRHFQVPDSIEGWGDAVNMLMRAAYETGEHVEFDYSLIRPQGSPLSTGGLAPGHLPLKTALEEVRAILSGAAWRKLRPIECHDIMCHLAQAVLAGGIRRSSLISIFSLEDTEMLYAKAHGNFVMPGMRDGAGLPLPPRNAQRAMANNSCAMPRATTTREQFARVVAVAKAWGDPGFYFTWHPDFGCNPCGEIGMHPVLTGEHGWDGVDRTLDFDPYVPRDPVLAAISANPGRYARFLSDGWEKLIGRHSGVEGRLGTERYRELRCDTDAEAVRAYGHVTGFQFCNLCEVNAAACRTPEELVEAVRAAATIGTLQAGYDEFPYLGPVTERVVRREALLGVGLTGIADNPDVALHPGHLRAAARAAVETNREVAAEIGVRPAQRVTTVKPSGTASLALGGVGSGIHPHHAKRYLRRVTANPGELPAVRFAEANPHAVEVKPDGDLSLVFPVEAPAGSVTLDDVSGLEFMDSVFSVYENWIVPGTAGTQYVGEVNAHPDGYGGEPALTHNVSCTVHVREGEWDAVIEKAWENRHRVTAMSFFPVTNDHAFPFAPRMAVTTPADEARWAELVSNYLPVDWSALGEVEDTTSPTMEPACAGGSCEVR